MAHIVLAGDSILDNAAYTGGEPAVIDHLRARLSANWRATLLAVDGSRTNDVARQFDRLPEDVTHMVVSTGGNDAIDQRRLLSEPTHSVADTLLRLSGVGERFERDYRRMFKTLATLKASIALCTIYYPKSTDPLLSKTLEAGLLVFNDVILRTAFSARVPVVDLRFVCNEPDDYANEIEPSGKGGAKIAQAILRFATRSDPGWQQTAVLI